MHALVVALIYAHPTPEVVKRVPYIALTMEYLGVYDGSITTSGPYVGAISMHLHWVLMLYRDDSITTSRGHPGINVAMRFLFNVHR